VYFVLMPFTVIAVYGLCFLARLFSQKIVGGIFVFCLAGLIGWMALNHPFQVVYFNFAGRHFAELFDRDEQRATSSVLLDWVLDHEEKAVTICGETDSCLLLTEEEKMRVSIAGEGEAEYFIDVFRNVVGNEPVHKGYEEVYASWVDGYKIGAVYQRIE